MPQTTPMIRIRVVLITCLALTAGAPGAPRSTSDQLSAEQSAIMQAVLDDARRHWQEREVPCISNALKSATSSNPSKHRISGSARLKSPFPICRQGSDAGRHFELHDAIVQGRDALISLDFVCPLCGHGTDYALRRIDGSWRILTRKASWVS